MTKTNMSRLSVGDRVEVRRRYDGEYSAGFTVAALDAGRVLVRRCSDNSVLPLSFAADELRRAGRDA